jgi:hypothetical protein
VSAAADQRLGAIDIGTNSVRLLAADIDGVGADAPPRALGALVARGPQRCRPNPHAPRR